MTGPFTSELDAVRAGFKAIMADNNKQHHKEFGFWVVMQLNAAKNGVNFFYTDIVDGGSGEVSMTLPSGMVRANCHTHPRRYSTGNFSTNDKKNFKYLRDKKRAMAFYLLTASGQISVANEEKDFPTGRNVSWS